MIRSLPSQAELRKHFDYVSETGHYIHKLRPELMGTKGETWNLRYAGKIAGQMNLLKKGRFPYWTIGFNYKAYSASRFAWMYHYGIDPGKSEIDHINRDTTDNRIENLRLATRSDNLCNRGKILTMHGLPTTNPATGVYPSKNGQWYAKITRHGKTYCLGTFGTLEDAVVVRNKKAVELHGQFYSGQITEVT